MLKTKVVCATPAQKPPSQITRDGDPTLISAAHGIGSRYPDGTFMNDHQLPVPDEPAIEPQEKSDADGNGGKA